ncbi:MAG: hypothetical protein VX000_01235, partial [Myxococcota bacterium]|nr:hypothetical protein [Myxococcota bacterium]
MSAGVCVTGVGVMSAAGAGYAALASALRMHRACGQPRAGALPVSRAATLPTPVEDIPGFPDDRKAALAVAALEEGLADAGLSVAANWPPADRRAVFLGTGLSSVTPGELAEDVFPHLQPDGAFDRAAMA